jgi:tRNA A37 threonylcarbamoyladenosine modification protein TsaB
MTGFLLAIETSNPSAWTPETPVRPGAVVIDSRGTLLARGEIDPQAVQQDQLMSVIASTVERAGITPRDLCVVAVSVGPGGYTAVRLAVTVAKFICEVTNRACVPVPAAHAVAKASGITGHPFAVALASKNQSVHFTRFGDDGSPSAEGALVEASALEAAGIRTLIADRFLPESFRVEAQKLGIALQAPVFDPLCVAHLACLYEEVDPVSLAAIYPREPEAVTKWRKLKESRA